ncbi:putative DNA-binding domain-containing protein [Microbulbifer sp. OS29]|uniref:DNA-binding domain-containing protein n=1 Tax=Microbulbifer okhotskensis TaxID=2926617 RepID=A0A9X2EP40_9GAMM|nr:putative DNA-binding domain-containing protein [Microbulbifer okhotskensis]MCO1335824.1 putative DNA-binding domain-containing protein [Microbulbifer okhotskensis]
MSSVVDKPEKFQGLQRGFAAHLRAPDKVAPPAEIEDRRMTIYRELIYNNIESFIASGFPVVRRLYNDDAWHKMVRDFVHRHRSTSPYFLQISEEFLSYLQNERGEHSDDPPFLLELAHYEWVELALDVSEAELPAGLKSKGDVLQAVPVVSPLVWSLSYSYPVHRLGPTFQPQEPPEAPTFLLVYRDPNDEVNFMEINAVTARLVQLASTEDYTGLQILDQMSQELPDVESDSLRNFGTELLEKLLEKGVIAGLKG